MKRLSSVMAIANEISEHSSVQFGERQRTMIVSRIDRRRQALGLKSEEDYIAYYEANREEEFKELLSLLTTHHTSFFRESRQFDYLKDSILPRILPLVRARTDRTLRIWSAACSRGHEVYSLAIFLDRVLRELDPEIKFEIVGTDIDAISVEFAENAVFLKKEIEPVPEFFEKGNFISGSGAVDQYVKVHPRIQKFCLFDVSNLNSPATWPKGSFDLIFCRNVFIYFSQKDVARMVGQLKQLLTPLGTLFVGMTEGLIGVSNELEPIGPSIYGRIEDWPEFKAKAI